DVFLGVALEGVKVRRQQRAEVRGGEQEALDKPDAPERDGMMSFLDDHEVLDHLKDDIAEDDETDEKRDDGARVVPCEEEDADDGPDDGKSHQRPLLADEADSGARITGLKHVYHQ